MNAIVLLLCLPCVSELPEKPVLSNEQLASLVAELESNDLRTRYRAAEKLVAAGPNAAPVIPALIKALDGEDSRNLAVNVLSAIGPKAKDAVPGLIAKLAKTHNSYDVEHIAIALMQIDGPKIEATRALLFARGKCTPILLVVSRTLVEKPEIIVPQLVTLCSDRDRLVRAKAVTVLGELKGREQNHKSLYELAGAGAKDVPATLEKLLADEHAEVRYLAAYTIGKLSPERSEKCIPVLIALAESGKAISHFNHYTTAQILSAVPKQTANALIPLFSHQNESLRTWAINTLAALLLGDELSELLATSKNAREREGAALAIGRMESASPKALPALQAALKDTDFAVRLACAHGILQRGTTDPKIEAATVPVFVEALGQQNAEIRIAASRQLRSLGAVAKPAIPALKKLLPLANVRLDAAFAVAEIDKNEIPATIPAFIGALRSKQANDAIRAAEKLATFGAVAADAVPELTKHFNAKSLTLRIVAAKAAALIDPKQAEAATTVLIRLLRDQETSELVNIREQSYITLAQIGAPAKAAIPTLRELLTSKTDDRGTILVTLAAIEPDNAANITEVRKTLAVSGHQDQHDSLEALATLGAGAKPFVPDIVAIVKAKERGRRGFALDILERLGEHAKDAIPTLKDIAKTEPNASIKKMIIETIELLEKK